VREETATREHKIEPEICEGKGGRPHADGSHPDLVREGIRAWVYGSYERGQEFRCPEEVGLLFLWLVDSLSGFLRVLENRGTLP